MGYIASYPSCGNLPPPSSRYPGKYLQDYVVSECTTPQSKHKEFFQSPNTLSTYQMVRKTSQRISIYQECWKAAEVKLILIISMYLILRSSYANCIMILQKMNE